jgi:threonine dehydrogenase-like Zn-dependent dehydrogenase
VRLRLTHVLTYDLDGVVERDAVAQDVLSGQRTFVPGRLPCGGCGLCRRGLAAACAAAFAAVADPAGAGGSGINDRELPDRFLTPIDEPAEALHLPPERAAAAGLVALAIQATAAANLTPGDVAIWLGGGPVARTGGQLTAGRGARTILVADALEVGDLPARLAAEAVEGAASGHQRSVRRLFLTRSNPDSLQAAGQLADPGAVLVVIARAPIALTGLVLPPEARLAHVAGYHPDLIPEALAELRRAELTLPAAERLTT